MALKGRFSRVPNPLLRLTVQRAVTWLCLTGAPCYKRHSIRNKCQISTDVVCLEAQGHLRCTRPAPCSSYSCFDIHICWNEPKDARMLPPALGTMWCNQRQQGDGARSVSCKTRQSACGDDGQPKQPACSALPAAPIHVAYRRSVGLTGAVTLTLVPPGAAALMSSSRRSRI